MSDVSQFLNSVSGAKYNTGLGHMPGVDIAPIVGLNGYSQQQAPQAVQAQGQAGSALSSAPSAGTQTTAAPTSMGSLFSGAPSNNGSHYTYDGSTGLSNPSTGNVGIGSAISGLGMLGNIMGNPQMSQLSGIAGALYGAANDSYTGLGGILGNASGVSFGGPIGAAIGSYFSPNDNTSRFLANTAVSMIPTVGPIFSIANTLTNGELSNSLFGKDAQKNQFGETTIAAQPGFLGNLGSTNNNANTTQQNFRQSEINSQNGYGNNNGYGGYSNGMGSKGNSDSGD